MLIITQGLGGSQLILQGYGGTAVAAPDVLHDRDSWHGKKRRPNIIPRKKASQSVQDLETLEDIWAEAKGKYNRPKPEVVIAKNAEYSPLEIAKFRFERQEAEDEEVVIKAALEYLLN